MLGEIPSTGTKQPLTFPRLRRCPPTFEKEEGTEEVVWRWVGAVNGERKEERRREGGRGRFGYGCECVCVETDKIR